MIFQRPQIPVQTFTVIAESTTVIRVAYLSLYCLEIRLRGGGLVAIRDAAYSRFDRASVLNEFTPTPGLKVNNLKKKKKLFLFPISILNSLNSWPFRKTILFGS